jgi:hypothetical protein
MSKINYSAGISPLPPNIERKVIDTLSSVGIPSISISSTFRTPAQQASAMYTNIVNKGIDSQRKLYGPAGNKVIDAYTLKKNYGYGQTDILKAMVKAINTVGPSNVSAHCVADPTQQVAFDILPGSIPKEQKKIFEDSMKSITSKLLIPGITTGEPVYHAEIRRDVLQYVSTIGTAIIALLITAFFLLKKGV